MGQIDEDFDNTRAQNPNITTEDLNHNNTLDIGEDIGIPFHNPDATITTLGANNLRIDSNDLDRNGTLNFEDPTVGGNIGYDASSGLIVAPRIRRHHLRFQRRRQPHGLQRLKFVRVPLKHQLGDRFQLVRDQRNAHQF